MQHLHSGPATVRPGATDGGHGPGPDTDPIALSPAEAERLLGLARIAVTVAVGAAPESALVDALAAAPLPERLGAAFVTLTEHGALRGCIGLLDEHRPAWVSVIGAARSAATRDPRFEPVDPGTLGDLAIAVSVLGPFVPLAEPAAFRPGTDGIVVRRGGHQALLLPEVAAELGGGHDAMLDACCRKAGLPADAWRDPATELHVFRTARVEGPLVVGG